jgi:protein-S-isoprenylcysteine O-methyltransferase Ste14
VATTIAAIVAVLFGAGVYVCVYHAKHRHHADQRGERERIPPVRAYRPIDRFFKIYTPPLVILCLLENHPLLLKVHDNTYLHVAGLVLAAVGMYSFLWSMRNLGNQFSPCDDAFVPTEMVTSGPYRYVRHPLYSSNLLLMSGLFLLSGSLWLVANLLLMAIFYGIAMSREEAALSDRFSQYREYCRITGRLLPKLRFHRQ